MGLGTLIRHHLQIAKIPLCLLVAFSGFFGYFLATVQTITPGLIVFLGILLLATGGATLNSVQERLADRNMGRTRKRPLVQGLITRRSGLLQAQLLLGAGFFILYAGFSSLGPVLAGMSAVTLYNFVYTPLKHKTVWAIIPGAFCGALPPTPSMGRLSTSFLISSQSFFRSALPRCILRINAGSTCDFSRS